MSRYDADDVYCIPGTAVLKNKAGITDQDLLDEYEGDFTAIRLLELTQNPIQDFFDLAHLCKIHSYLFQDVYEWAGEVRSVDIIRGDSRFCNVRQRPCLIHNRPSGIRPRARPHLWVARIGPCCEPPGKFAAPSACR